jgi:hypothetical protein
MEDIPMARTAVEQKAQWGTESVPGTAVTADEVFTGMEVEASPKVETGTIATQGKRFASKVYKKKEWTEGKVSGVVDYNAQAMSLDWVLGSVTEGTPADGCTARTFTVGAAGTRTIVYGDSTEAARVAGCFVTSASWKWGRNSGDTAFEASFTGGLWEQGQTLATATAEYSIEPVEAGMVDVFVDTAWGDLGDTHVPSALSVEVKLDGLRSDDWRLNSATPSLSGSKETAVKGEVSLLVECNAAGRAFLSHLRAGQVLYVRVAAEGQPIGTADDVQAFVMDLVCQVETYETGSDDDLYTSKVTLTVIEDAAGHNVQVQTLTDI